MNENKTNINWYPGHMAKTKRLISDELKNIDIVYEVIDARIPFSSKIKDIDSLIKNKNKILIMTKKDLCDLNTTNKWVSYYKNKGYSVLVVDLKNNLDYKKIIDTTHEVTKELQIKRNEKGLNNNEDYKKIIEVTHEVMESFNQKREEKGMNKRSIRALVIGIPNVGKSTLINKLSGKKSANVENRPGVTTSLNYLKTNVGITILDTPGILWPKLDNENVALNIAAIGSIKQEILNMDEICIHILNILSRRYPHILKELYNIDNYDVMDMYEVIAHKIGAFKNGEVIYDKVSLKVYNDVVKGIIKGVTYDEYQD